MNRKGIAFGVALCVVLGSGVAVAEQKQESSKPSTIKPFFIRLPSSAIKMTNLKKIPNIRNIESAARVTSPGKDVPAALRAPLVPDPLAIYSNVDNSTGYYLGSSACALVGANSVTRARLDDVQFPTYATTSPAFDTLTFSFCNLNPDGAGGYLDFDAQVYFHFYLPDGASGGPGTYYGTITTSYGGTGWPGGCWSGFQLTGLSFTLPTPPPGANSLWWGFQIDNADGTLLATCTELLLMGQLLYAPPVIGTSADLMFRTDPPSVLTGVSNPTGVFQTGGPGGGYGLYGEFIVAVVPVHLQSFTAD